MEGEEAEEEAADIAKKYSRRPLDTNADRYVEPDPELDSDGMILPSVLNCDYNPVVSVQVK